MEMQTLILLKYKKLKSHELMCSVKCSWVYEAYTELEHWHWSTRCACFQGQLRSTRLPADSASSWLSVQDGMNSSGILGISQSEPALFTSSAFHNLSTVIPRLPWTLLMPQHFREYYFLHGTRVVITYVPHTLYPSTSTTMYPVLPKPCTRNIVPSTVDTIYFYQKFNQKSGIISVMLKKVS